MTCLSLVSALAQDGPQRREGTPPGDMVVGKVTAVNGDSITIAPLAGGNPVTVKVSDNTRVSKERQPARISDIKTDETVFARGTLNGNSLDARMVAVVNPEMVQRLQQGGGMGMGGGNGMAFNREDLGKKFIMGEVKAINETKLTIARPDNQTQDIEVDENTSFKRGNESITLADIKVGDRVGGPGELKNGVFVPKELRVGRPGMGMGAGRGEGAGQGHQKKPDADKPAPPKN
ncbi:MAG: hypothetical protein DMG65_02995 [Candidatus Angelobacter sp. Gp1-AA117]|nr:MAG: hypothetical protein DMG65_02995 [Candidatus Angelobacter sp. Gp1-AA117]